MVLHRRTIWLSIVVLVIITGTTGIIAAQHDTRTPPRDTFVVVPRDVIREVTVTGTVEAAAEVALAFPVGGRIARVTAAVGDRVVADAPLVTLDQADLLATRAQEQAAVAAARADLAALRVGTRAEEIHVQEISRDNARRALADAETTRTNVTTKAQADLTTLYDSAPNVLRAAYTKTDDAVRKQTDELFSNDATANPQLTFQTADVQAEIDAERDRRTTEILLQQWPPRIATLEATDDAARDVLLVTMTADATAIRAFLERAFATVNAALNINAATIAAYKVSVGTARTNVDAAQTAVDDHRQAIALQHVVNRNAIAAAQADATTARNALATAEAALALSRAPATPEAIAAQEASVATAMARVAHADADLAKSVLRAPFNGVVSIMDAKPGAIATAGAPLVTVLADATFEITAHIPEVDLAGLAVGQEATVTLDAYGPEHRFRATVATIDPAATIVDGVPTYATTLTLDDADERVRAGMTADVTIAVDRRSNVLAVPQRALIRRDDATVVRVLRGDRVEDVRASIGLRGSDGYAEITSGLTAGDTVVRSVDDG